jgi:hypothetical protein
LKTVKKKSQITYKSKHIKMIADFSSKILKARGERMRYFEHGKKKN